MAEHTKLVLIAYYQHYRTKKQSVKGYVMDLPKTIPGEMRVKFRELSEVQVAKNFELRVEKSTCAVFDHQTDEIIWANVGLTANVASYPWSYPINIWRFDKYCQNNGQERSASPSHSDTEPSVIIKGNIISCSGVGLKSETSKWNTVPSQKAADDKEWRIVPFSTPTSMDTRLSLPNIPSLAQSTLFASNDVEIEYVYNARILEDTDSAILLDVMKASRFNNLRNDSSPVWQSFEIQMNFKVYNKAEAESKKWEGVKMAFTRDENNKKWRLYFIKKDRATGNVNMAYIPLRSDGSVESFKNKITAQGQISPYIGADGDLKVFVFDKKMLVLGRFGWDISGSIAEISSDGSPPAQVGYPRHTYDQPVWRRVGCDFENFIEPMAGTRIEYMDYRTAGCTVPESFAP